MVKLKPTDMQGGTFTVSSLGGLGSKPLLQLSMLRSAILGCQNPQLRQFEMVKICVPCLMLPLSLSF